MVQIDTSEAQLTAVRVQIDHLRTLVHALQASGKHFEVELQREVDTRHQDDEVVMASLSQLRRSFEEQVCGRGARAEFTVAAEAALSMRQAIATLEERSQHAQDRQDDCARRQKTTSASLEALRASLASDLGRVDESRRTGDRVLEAELARMMQELDSRLRAQMASFDELFEQLDAKLCAKLDEAHLQELSEAFGKRVARLDRALAAEAGAREEADLRNYEAIDELSRLARDGLAHDGFARDGVTQQSSELDRLKLEFRSALAAQSGKKQQQSVERDRYKQELMSALEVRLCLTGLYSRAAAAGSEAQWKSSEAEEQHRNLQVRVAGVEEKLQMLDAAVTKQGGLFDEIRKVHAPEAQSRQRLFPETFGASWHPRNGSRGASSAVQAQSEAFLMRDV